MEEPLGCGHPWDAALEVAGCRLSVWDPVTSIPLSPRAPCDARGHSPTFLRHHPGSSRPAGRASGRQKGFRGIIFRRRGREAVIRRPPLSPRVPSGAASRLQRFGPGTRFGQKPRAGGRESGEQPGIVPPVPGAINWKTRRGKTSQEPASGQCPALRDEPVPACRSRRALGCGNRTALGIASSPRAGGSRGSALRCREFFLSCSAGHRER